MNESTFNENLFYPLYKPFDKEMFGKLKKTVSEGCEFEGSNGDKQYFVKALLVFQLIHDYRAQLEIVNRYLSKKVGLKQLNQEMQEFKFEIDRSWAVFKSQIEMIDNAKEVFSKDLTIMGNKFEYNEFVLRYLISIWLADWEGPLFAVLRKLKADNYTLKLNELNSLLSLWDFTSIFKN